MRKKLLLTLSLVVSTLVGYSQELTPKMLNVYNGKVKSITILEPEVQKGVVYEFQEDGRIKAVIQNTMKSIFNWLSDDEAKCELLNDGIVVETAYLYINEYSELFYDYDAGTVNIKMWFKDNGAVSHGEILNNGTIFKTEYFYHNDSDIAPYKIVNQVGTQTQTTFVKINKVDKQGNITEFVQTCNGQSIKSKRIIKYY